MNIKKATSEYLPVLLSFTLSVAIGFIILQWWLAPPTSRSITVSLSIEPALLPTQAKDWHLSVYATKPNTRLPLSFYSGQLSELPTTIVLEQDNYLLAQHTLADSQQFIVVAKASENPDPHSRSDKDLIGISPVLDFDSGAKQKIELKINRLDNNH